MKFCRITLLATLLLLFSACSKEPPPRSVNEFLDDPLLLEAALVRCTQDRAATRYAAECVNVREAVKQVEAKEAEERRATLEAQSQRKRDALRRTQQAAAEARRRV
ncbi:MAG: EexN family lipoprotein, partial [Woeseiaceae bacterium]|nr:EexN family lipoprotein [Woeseiaceae bacterium]